MKTPIYIAILCLLVGWVSAAYGQQPVANIHGPFTIDIDCSACHQTDAWKPLRDTLGFDHSRQTRFSLTGSHTLTKCVNCHIDMRFDVPKVEINDCASCHVDVHQSEFAGGCVDCHNTTSFQVDGIEIHNRTRFPLTGAHVQISCESCHRTDEGGAFSLLDTECLACHEPDYEAAHGAAGFPTTCETCHNTLAWAATPPFDHAAISGGFALLGAHEALACSDCHQEPNFQPIFAPADQDDCFSCHQQNYEQEHAGTGFPTACTDCHETDTWEGAVFDHASLANGFDLVGSHLVLDCAACHGPPPGFTPIFSPVDENDCSTCHQPDFQAAHAGSGFPTTCLTCHGTDTWQGAVFEHAPVANGFALLGAHEQLPCAACHQPPPGFEPLFSPVDQDDCFTCHQPDYQDEHADSGFPTQCLACHTVDSWDGAVFDHASVADGFGLVGAHRELDCAACHQPPPGFESIFSPVDENDCLTCHQPDYEQQHAADGFPTTCLTCHDVEGWDHAAFDHGAAADGFDLIGVHGELECAACHQPPPGFESIFSPVDENDCLTCHQPDFQSAHAGSGYPTTCLACHNIDAWDDATFEHASVANGFALLGAHGPLDCSSCHAPPPGFEPLFTPVDQDDCLSCHQTDYEQQHAGTGFPTQCLACHTVEAWDGAVFNHAAVANGFELVGAHVALDCSSCHAPPPGFEPLFSPGDEEDCYACHQPDYQAAHAGSGFPTSCQTCHNADDWTEATFEHASVASGFALVGAHEQLPCLACHAAPPDFSLIFSPLDQDDCFSCHQTNYEQQHAGTGFPTECLACHNVNTWSDVDFDHGSVANGFGLIGAHSQLACTACHAAPPDFTPLFSPVDENDCYACHQPDYDQQHAAEGFPFECLICHNVNAWSGANFSHSGSSNGFRLLGAHETLPCSACHAPPPDFSPLFNPTDDEDCYTCHQDDYQQEHGGSGFPTTCLTCHNTTDWRNTDFDHDNDYFPIFSGRHEGEWATCNTCHIQPEDFSIFSCLTCHEHNQQDMDEEHRDVPGYVYESTACYSCHPAGED